jgi:hypothetical protein
MPSPIDPEALMIEAAKGSREAQSALIDLTLDYLFVPEETCRRACMVAEVFARLAAAHGDPDDELRLAHLLFISAKVASNVGDQGDAERLAVDGLMICNRLADQGNDKALSMLVNISKDLTPYALGIAAEMCRRDNVEEA